MQIMPDNIPNTGPNAAQRTAIALLLLWVVALCPFSAQAATVFNLSDAPKQIEVHGFNGFKPVDIPAWRKFSVPGNVNVRFNGREVYIQHNEEYAIWPDGTFGPQRHVRSMRGY